MRAYKKTALRGLFLYDLFIAPSKALYGVALPDRAPIKGQSHFYGKPAPYNRAIFSDAPCLLKFEDGLL